MPQWKCPFPKKKMQVERALDRSFLLVTWHINFSVGFQVRRTECSLPASCVLLTQALGDRDGSAFISPIWIFSMLLSVLGQTIQASFSLVIYGFLNFVIKLSSLPFQYSLFYCLILFLWTWAKAMFVLVTYGFLNFVIKPEKILFETASNLRLQIQLCISTCLWSQMISVFLLALGAPRISTYDLQPPCSAAARGNWWRAFST